MPNLKPRRGVVRSLVTGEIIFDCVRDSLKGLIETLETFLSELGSDYHVSSRAMKVWHNQPNQNARKFLWIGAPSEKPTFVSYNPPLAKIAMKVVVGLDEDKLCSDDEDQGHIVFEATASFTRPSQTDARIIKWLESTEVVKQPPAVCEMTIRATIGLGHGRKLHTKPGKIPKIIFEVIASQEGQFDDA
jgi:hypothetical protein